MEFDALGQTRSPLLPPALVGLPNLRVLDLSNNELNGAAICGENWADATRLERLNLWQQAARLHTEFAARCAASRTSTSAATS